MKRSEMIEFMARTLEKNFDFDNGNWTEDAEKLLDQMEYIGVLPPFSETVFQKEWARDRDPVTCCGNKWEKE